MPSQVRSSDRRQLTSLRLTSQLISGSEIADPADVVRWMLAMQAQDYGAALWAIALRAPGSTIARVGEAIASRAIVRSWPMRGTLHFTASEDLAWMLQLNEQRMHQSLAGRYRNLGLDDRELGRARELAISALDEGVLTRADLLAAIERGDSSSAGTNTAGIRGAHILLHLALTRTVVFAQHLGKQPTFALFHEWIPASRALDRDEALGELALRYFRSHGPASVHDLAWWAGLTLSDTRKGLAIALPELEALEVSGSTYYRSRRETAAAESTHALPGFDEYLLGYRDRSAQLAVEHSQAVVPGNNGIFLPTFVRDGEIVGTWKREERAKEIVVTFQPFVELDSAGHKAIRTALEPYGVFHGKPVRLQG